MMDAKTNTSVIHERNAAERFLYAVQAAIRHRAFNDDLTEQGLQKLLGRFERAIPIAQSVVITSNPLDPDQPAIEAFVEAEEDAARRAESDSLDPGDLDARMTAANDARHVMALAIGLLQTDRLL